MYYTFICDSSSIKDNPHIHITLNISPFWDSFSLQGQSIQYTNLLLIHYLQNFRIYFKEKSVCSIFYPLKTERDIEWSYSIPALMDEFKEWKLKWFWSTSRSRLQRGIAAIVQVNRKIKRSVTTTDGVFSCSIFQ